MGLQNRPQKAGRLFDGSKINVINNGIKTFLKAVVTLFKVAPAPGVASIPPPTQTTTPTPTLTPSQTPTIPPTPSNTATPKATPTNTSTPSHTPTNTKTPTQTKTSTKTPPVTKTPTKTQTPTKSQTQTPTKTPTNTATNTATPSSTPTNTATNTATPSPTPTNTATPTNTKTPTTTPTNTRTQTPTKTNTPTITKTPTNTQTNTRTQTPTKTSTPTNTQTQTNTRTQTQTPTNTQTNTQTPTNSQTNTQTPTNSQTTTQTPTVTRTQTRTPVPCYCWELNNISIDIINYGRRNCNNVNTINNVIPPNTVQYFCMSNIFTSQPDQLIITNLGPCADLVGCPPFTQTPTKTQTPTPSNTATNTATVSQTPTITPTNTATPSLSPTNTATPSPTITESPTNTPTPSITTTNTQTNTQTPTLTQTNTQTPTYTQTPTQTPTETCSKPGGLINVSFLEIWYTGPVCGFGTTWDITGLSNEEGCANYTEEFLEALTPCIEATAVQVTAMSVGGKIYNTSNSSCVCNLENGKYWVNAVDYTNDVNKTDGINIITVLNCEITEIYFCAAPPPPPTQTPTPTYTPTVTNTPSQTATEVKETPTQTPTYTSTPSQTPTYTPTQTNTPSCAAPGGLVLLKPITQYTYNSGGGCGAGFETTVTFTTATSCSELETYFLSRYDNSLVCGTTGINMRTVGGAVTLNTRVYDSTGTSCACTVPNGVYWANLDNLSRTVTLIRITNCVIAESLDCCVKPPIIIAKVGLKVWESEAAFIASTNQLANLSINVDKDVACNVYNTLVVNGKYVSTVDMGLPVASYNPATFASDIIGKQRYPISTNNCGCPGIGSTTGIINYEDPTQPPTTTSGVWWIKWNTPAGQGNCLIQDVQYCGPIPVVPSPTPTQTVTQTPSQTPNPILEIGNIPGVNPLAFNLRTIGGSSTGTLDWGDGTNQSITWDAAALGANFIKTYANNSFVAKLSNVSNFGVLGEVQFTRISSIGGPLIFQQSSFPNTTKMTISSSRLTNFNISLGAFDELTISNSVTDNITTPFLNFNPSDGPLLTSIIMTNIPIQVFQPNLSTFTSLTAITISYTNNSATNTPQPNFQSVILNGPSSLKDFNLLSASGPNQPAGFTFSILNPSNLTSLTGLNLTDSSLRVFDITLPKSVRILNLGNTTEGPGSLLRNRIINFNPTIPIDSELREVTVESNVVLNQFTSQIINCSLLRKVTLTDNAMTTFPIFPNSTEIIYFNGNALSGPFDNNLLPTNIKELYLQRSGVNQFRTNPITIFTNNFPNSLHTLDVGFNVSLTQLNVQGLGITALTISSNIVRVLDFSLFPALKTLNNVRQAQGTSRVFNRFLNLSTHSNIQDITANQNQFGGLFVNINRVQIVSNVATLTATTAHNFTAGQQVSVVIVQNGNYNGTYTITSTPTTTSFTYNIPLAANNGPANVTAANSYASVGAGADAVCSGNWPSSLRTLNLSSTYGITNDVQNANNFFFSNWNKSFVTATNLRTLNLQNCGITRTSVDLIICSLKDSVVSNFGVNPRTAGTISINNTLATPAAVLNQAPSRFITITNKVLNANVATLTTSVPHNFLAGQTVVVSGVDAIFDGTYTINAGPGLNTFSYNRTNGNITSAAATGQAITTNSGTFCRNILIAAPYNWTVTTA